MPQREFEITIGKTGEVELHVKGFKGRACLDAVKVFEEIVGELKSEQHTSEFYEPEEQVRHRLDQRH
jgi:Protein of unknown function (DUF2997)